MKTRILEYRILITILMLLIIVSVSTISCSQGSNSSSGNRNEEKKNVNSDMNAKIKSILSHYDPAALTPEIASEINNKFREAGIHPGPETKDAISAAGFDPDKLRSLAPPPPGSQESRKGPVSDEDRMKVVDEKIIKPLSLNSSQSETVTIAFREFFSDIDKIRKTQQDSRAPVEKSKIDPLEKARDEKISKVLSQEQYLRYTELEKASRPPKPDQKGEK
jgi:hypothetical protein